jgi:predicted nuclease with TOPRIM domain
MENLNAEQIKKQMQDWSNGICENACLKGECLNGIIVACENCMPNTVRNALALINSQEQRIKELTEENERLREDNNQWTEKWADNQRRWENLYRQLKIENEMLLTHIPIPKEMLEEGVT